MLDEIDLVPMVIDHQDMDRLCDRLEVVADNLPHLPSPDVAFQLCRELEHRPQAHEALERALFHGFFTNTALERSQAAALEFIQHRSGAHVVQAQDIVAALQPGSFGLPASTLGYMLRSFFESCRAAMALEELAVLHFAGNRLTSDAKAMLEQSLEARCRF